MLIRIFAFQGQGQVLDKYLNFLRLKMGGSGVSWTIEHCDPVTWQPTPGDIHIHLEIPVRIAVPWAKYNIFATDMDYPMWAWTKTDMDLIVSKTELTERNTAIPCLQKAFTAASRGSHPPALPLPPVKGKGAEIPKVGIITVTRNRKNWWANMVQNIVKQDWPVSRMEWIIVDDGDEGERLGPEVDAFMEKSPGIMIRFVESLTPLTIGAKRNMAVEAAAADTTVFVCMDDDDHYPANSIGARIAWLKRNLPEGKDKDKGKDKGKEKGKEKGKDKDRVQSQIGYCSVIPMYDVTRYISAMNVPELELGAAERVSEATLIFTREAWAARPFPDISMAEGLGFIEGREELTVEMPPKGIIVSFIHSANSSSRRIPKEEEPNGCHYGFADEFFKYLHTIGNIKPTPVSPSPYR